MADLIEILSPKALSDLKAANELIVELIGNIGKAGNMTIGSKTPSGSDSAVKQLNDDYLKQQKIIDDLNVKLGKYAEAKRKINGLTVQERVDNSIILQQAKQQATIVSEVAGAYRKLSAEQSRSATNVQNIIAAGRQAGQSQRAYNTELRTAQKEFDGLNKRVLEADHAVGRFQRNVGNYPKLLQDVNSLLGALGISLGAVGAAMLAKSIFDTTKELQSLDLALKQITGSNEEAARAQLFLNKVSEDFGIDVKVLTKAYIGFFASSKNAIEGGKISAIQIRDIFRSVSKAAGAMGLSVEQQEGAFLALSQMISKGNVQAEELRGRLSERLPGAFGILAKSMGVTEKQLNQMLKDGKVLAADVLPAFARELEKAYGVENLNRVETLNASVTRLSNSWTNFVRALNEGDGIFSTTLSTLIDALADVLKGYEYLLTSSEKLRADKLKRIRAEATDSTLEYYQDQEKIALEALKNSNKYKNATIDQQQEMVDAIKKSQIDEVESTRNNLRLKVQDQYDAVQKLNNANQFLQVKINNPKLFYKGDGNQGYLKEQQKNIESIKKYNEYISYLNGTIEAYNEYLKTNTKNTHENAESVDYSNIVLAAKIRYLKDLVDASRAVYEAEKKRREIDIENTKQLSDNENTEFSDRIEYLGKYLKKRQDLLEFSFNYEVAQIEKQRATDFDEAEKAEKAAIKQILGKTSIANATKQQQEAINQVVGFYKGQKNEINKKFDAIDLKNQREYSDAYMDVAEDTAKAEVLIKQKQREILKSIDKVYLDRQAEMFKKNADNEKLSVDIREAAYLSYIEVRQKQLQTDRIAAIAAAKTDEELKLVIATYDGLKSKLNEETKNDPYKQAADQSTAALKSLAEGIQNGFLSDAGLGSLSQFFDGTFDKIIEGFDKIENKADSFREKAIYTALAVSEVFQEAFNAISKASSENFDLERSNLEKKYATSKLFAEGNADALAELDKEAEERRRFIANREAKANKRLAEFNIAINAAQGIVAAFKDGNVIKGAIFAAIIAGVAAVQIAALESADVPQYWKGTENHPGGLMRINDQKGSKYREIVETPDGKLSSPTNRNVLMKAPKGTKVYTADQSAIMFDNGLNAVLNERGISMGGNTTVVNDYAPLLGKLDQVNAAISSIPQRSFKLNDSGLGQLVRETTAGQERMNTSLRRIAIIYRP